MDHLKALLSEELDGGDVIPVTAHKHSNIIGALPGQPDHVCHDGRIDALLNRSSHAPMAVGAVIYWLMAYWAFRGTLGLALHGRYLNARELIQGIRRPVPKLCVLRFLRVVREVNVQPVIPNSTLLSGAENHRRCLLDEPWAEGLPIEMEMLPDGFVNSELEVPEIDEDTNAHVWCDRASNGVRHRGEKIQGATFDRRPLGE